MFMWKVSYVRNTTSLSLVLVPGSAHCVLKSINTQFGVFLVVSSKKYARNVATTGDMGWIPGLERSLEGWHGNPCQYSCLENPMEKGAWWATAHRITKSQTWVKCLASKHQTCHLTLNPKYLCKL